MKEKRNILLAGALTGVIAVVLVVMGNPSNMGFCIACFERDIAGALGLHGAAVVQYLRPEILGLVLGAFLLSVLRGEFRAKGGSSPFTRFILGFAVMVCALVFLGCPLRMVLRIAGGDWNAIVGLLGFAGGIWVGTLFLNRGFTLKRTYTLAHSEGVLFPLLQGGLLVLLVAAPFLLKFSEKGPGASHAPIWIALGAGLIVGMAAQKTRLCMVGGVRDAMLFRDFNLLLGFCAILAVALVGNLLTGRFHPGFLNQPVAHIDALWNFLSMVGVGLGSVLLGGCPLRQLILAGEGNTDSAITVIGGVLGAAFAHNFKLASSATVAAADGTLSGGATVGGKIAVVVLLVLLVGIAFANLKKSKQAEEEKAI
ncbi:MAG: YedE family putative selenium transporter [Ruthenibacterium sp.]